jgi:hypothetical protein
MISSDDLDAMIDLCRPLPDDVAALTGAMRLAYIFDAWPFTLHRDTTLQPAVGNLPLSLTNVPYLNLSNLSFTTDRAWSLHAARIWLCGTAGHPDCNDDELTRLTQASCSSSYASYANGTRDARWRFAANASFTRIERSLLDPALLSFGLRECTHGGSVCADVLTQQYHPQLYTLASVWMLALPGGPATVHSSYSWERNFSSDARGEDTRWYTGPPRTASGATATVRCGVDLLAEGRVDGGTRWNCEHRHNLVEVMPMWRAQVDETWELLHLQGIRGAVAFARGAESGGASRRHGWVMINRNETLIDVQIETGPSHRPT